MTRSLLVAVLLFALQGCRSDHDGIPAMAVRDSAGTRIVENRGDPGRTELGWRVDPAPLLDIGGGEDATLHRVTAATRLEDGRLAVANSGAGTFEIYGADGRHLQTVGRPGDGPGEFRALFWIGWLAGDSIVTWDSGLSRMSVFAADGRFVRAVTPRGALGLFPQGAGLLRDGRLLVAIQAPTTGDGTGTRVRRDSVSYAAIGRDGEVQPVARVAGTEMLMSGDAAGGLLMRPLPFGRQTVAAAHGGLVYVGTGDRFELLAYEPAHGLREVVRAQHRPVPVTHAEIAEYRRSLVTLGTEGDARLRRQHDDLLASAPYPEEMPPFTNLKIDPDGNLWLQTPHTGGAAEQRWVVFSRDGRALGSLRAPGKVNVQEIGRDWLLGIALDDDQVEHVRMYRLVKPG